MGDINFFKEENYRKEINHLPMLYCIGVLLAGIFIVLIVIMLILFFRNNKCDCCKEKKRKEKSCNAKSIENTTESEETNDCKCGESETSVSE
tara:strand:+ start:951 stop:1226 length:276 start_codon:yes stop_codon:yes gene_type:complete